MPAPPYLPCDTFFGRPDAGTFSRQVLARLGIYLKKPLIGGTQEGVIGTSASSPEFAGLVALKIQSSGGRFGNENFDIYALAAAQENGSENLVFRQDIPGNNGKYKARSPGYNLVLGNGTVFGARFVRGPGLAVAGKPQTPTNP